MKNPEEFIYPIFIMQFLILGVLIGGAMQQRSKDSSKNKSDEGKDKLIEVVSSENPILIPNDSKNDSLYKVGLQVSRRAPISYHNSMIFPKRTIMLSEPNNLVRRFNFEREISMFDRVVLGRSDGHYLFTD